MVARQGNGGGVGVGGERENGTELSVYGRQRGLDFAPWPAMLLARDASELVEHLDTDDPTVGKRRKSTALPRIVEESVDHNVGIEERAHRLLASSWSKRLPSGKDQR